MTHTSTVTVTVPDTRIWTPQDMALAAPTLVEDFEDVDDWSLIGAGASKEADTTNYQEGTQSMKVTTASGGNATVVRDWGSTRDLSGVHRIGLWVYFYNDNPITSTVASSTFSFSSVSNFATRKQYTATQAFVSGWQHFQLPLSLFSDVGGEDWSNIRYVQVWVGSKAGMSSVFSLDGLTYGQVSIPGFIFYTDDGYDGAYDICYAKMKTYGMRAVIPVVTDNMSTGNYCTWDELREMYMDGWDIVSHGKDHTNLTTLTEEQQEANLGAAQTALQNNGLTRSASYLAYPWGPWNGDTVTAMGNLGIVLGRTATPLSIHPGTLPMFCAHALEAQLAYDTTTLEEVQGWIDAAITNQYILSVVTHEVGSASNMTQAVFEGMVDYLYGKRDQIYVLTMDDLYQLSLGSCCVAH